jgi:hypothetical protein
MFRRPKATYFLSHAKYRTNTNLAIFKKKQDMPRESHTQEGRVKEGSLR